jgi:hypothetical protein
MSVHELLFSYIQYTSNAMSNTSATVYFLFRLHINEREFFLIAHL